MAKSAAQRQREYRARRPEAGDNGERRVNTWISTRASLALKRLAARNGVTVRAVIEQLAIEADQVATVGMTEKEFDDYLSVTQ